LLWFWGLAGAFIYAGPRWVIALASRQETRVTAVICTMEMLVALGVGTAAAAAFGPLGSKVALTTLQVQDDNAVCALLGLFANRLAPMLVDKGSSALTSSAEVAERVLKALKGDQK
jgi:hypothetical protein